MININARAFFFFGLVCSIILLILISILTVDIQQYLSAIQLAISGFILSAFITIIPLCIGKRTVARNLTSTAIAVSMILIMVSLGCNFFSTELLNSLVIRNLSILVVFPLALLATQIYVHIRFKHEVKT